MVDKCYILGGGASFGYDTDLPWIQQPSLTEDLFIKGSRLGILTEERFPQLLKGIHYYIEEELPDDNITISEWEQDIEEGTARSRLN